MGIPRAVFRDLYGKVRIPPYDRSSQISTARYVYRPTTGNSSSPHFQLKFTGFTSSSFHTSTAHSLTFAVTLHFVAKSSAFSSCFCNPSGVYDIPTRSSANIDPDNVSSPAVTPCLAASTAIIRSSTYILNRIGDNVHPCATLCKISTYFNIYPSSITALLTHSVICFISLHILPLILIAHSFFHNPFLHAVSEAFSTSTNKQYVRPAYFLPRIISPNVCIHGLRSYGLA